MPILLAGSLTLALAGCEGSQSALHVSSPDAAAISRMAWVMMIGGGLIFVAVMALSLFAVFARADRRAWLARRQTIVAGGIVFPVVTLSALLLYSLWMTRGIGAAEPVALRIEVVGEQFWWRVHYLDGEGKTLLASANEIHIPVGRTVELSLATKDVIHSFWVPSLAGKLDMVPGRVNVLPLRADRPGVFRGQCAEYCGIQHARMALYVVAHAADEFDAWLQARLHPTVEPADARIASGAALFVTLCAVCHTVRGTPAQGKLGPDLTHVGSRLTLAAGTLPNTKGAAAGWIASAQHIKPGNRMPSFDKLTSEELLSVAGYMESLQ